MRRKRTVKNGLLLLLLCLLLTACAGKELSGAQNSDADAAASDATDADTSNAGNSDAEEASKEAPYTGPLREGDAYRDFTAVLADGSDFKLSGQEGKVILLNFWATWCGPCVKEMPAFTRLTEAYGDDLCLVAVNCGEKEDTVQDFLAENGYSFPVALDPDDEISALYPTDGIPYTVIIAQDGTVSSIHLGATDAESMFALYSAEIDKLLSSE